MTGIEDDGPSLSSPGAGPSRISLDMDKVDEVSRRKVANGSRASLDQERHEEAEQREMFMKRRSPYHELQANIDSSTELLDSLASYLSTFQTDLSAVSGQVSDLQARSKEIEDELSGRKNTLPLLNALLADITLPPALVLTLRDTQPASNPDLWLSAIIQLDDKLAKCQAYAGPGVKSSEPSTPTGSAFSDTPNGSEGGVEHDTRKGPAWLTNPTDLRAAKEMNEIINPLVLRALHLLPPFLLSLIKPLRSPSKGLSTNLAILQSNLLLKYQPFYAFVLRHAPRLAKEVERGYAVAARSYYETAFRRYTRALGLVKARNEGPGLVGGVGKAVEYASTAVGATKAAAPAAPVVPAEVDPLEGIKYALKPEDGGAGDVVLMYQAEDKDFTMPIEGLYKSLQLVLLDNASAEYTFLIRFFARARVQAAAKSLAFAQKIHASTAPPGDRHREPETPSASASVVGASIARHGTPDTARRTSKSTGTDLSDANRLFNEVFSTALDSCTAFFQSIITPSSLSTISTGLTSLPAAQRATGGAPVPVAGISSTVPLLTMIRINDRAIALSDARSCTPLSTFLQGQKMALWPLYRKDVDARIEAMRKLADDAEGKGFAVYAGMLGRGVKDSTVREKAKGYARLVGACARLGDEMDDVMVFSSLTRLRAQLVRLLVAQTNKLKQPADHKSALSAMYEEIIQELINGVGPMTHPRMQAELAFLKAREEEARRG